MKNIIALFLLIGLSIFSYSQTATDTIILNDTLKASNSVSIWSEETFKSSTDARFEKFKANYTDEYLMANLRLESLEKSKLRTERSYKEGKFKGTKKDYNERIVDYDNRIKEAKKNNLDFKPRVTSYSIRFWSNVLLDSGVSNYIEFEVILNDNFEVIKTIEKSRIGETNNNAKIWYK